MPTPAPGQHRPPARLSAALPAGRPRLAAGASGFGSVFLFVCCAVLTIASGCFHSQRAAPPPAAIAEAVPAESPSPEELYWRQRYRQNRPVPPEEYRVLPKPPRNNQFGEFDDALYQGLDQQAELPALPGDAFMPQLAGGTFPPGPPLSRMAPAAPLPAPAPQLQPHTVAVMPAGITAGSRFIPVEQLVYGGGRTAQESSEEYRLMPRDVITLAVRDHPEFSGQIEIQADGSIKIPAAHDVISVRGMTAAEAAGAVTRALQVYVRGECEVMIQTNRAEGGYYFVFGDVLQPGRFPMGMEAVKLSDAVLAANWEASPARPDAGADLGPAFPAASPRGRFTAPPTADLARVVLVTPHRSQPARSVHDVRSAMMGMTANDPAVRPGQIILVPSLDPARNRALGLDTDTLPVPAEGAMTGNGFSGSASPARLPDAVPQPAVSVPAADSWGVSAVEANMAAAFDENMNSSGSRAGPVRVIYQESFHSEPMQRRESSRRRVLEEPAGEALRGGPGAWGP